MSKRQNAPMNVLLDLLGRRWALRILWELRDEELSFRELQARCADMSASVLNDRIGELCEAGIVHSDRRRGYRLSRHGAELAAELTALDPWARRWARRKR